VDWSWLEHAGVQTVLGVGTFLGYALTWLLIPVVLLTKKRWPASTVAWLMAILMLPYLGAIGFLVFGIDRMSKRVRRRREQVAAILRLASAVPVAHATLNHTLSEPQRRLIKLAKDLARTTLTDGNRLQVYHQAGPAFEAIEAAIRDARHSIHLEYYIFQPDHVGTRIRDLLIARAKQGVRVRFLYDSVGSLRLSRGFVRPMREAGIEVRPFLPGRGFWERWSINFRSHRKIVVVDGRVGFTGGMNIGDEYLGLSRAFGAWRDCHLRIEGPMTLQLQDVFLTDWFSATGEELFDDAFFPTPHEPGRVAGQIVAGGPDCDPNVFHTLMFAALGEARRTIHLATSYFVPTPSLCEALIAAALRGVRVRIMLTSPVTYWVSYHATRSFFDELLAAGVELYEYIPGQQHAKTLTIDGEWALVGTPNFDPRSVFLNFEVAAVCYDDGVIDQLDHAFDRDLAETKRIEPVAWSRRSNWQRVKENACRMFVPVL
jgi:cardiolipin synthase